MKKIGQTLYFAVFLILVILAGAFALSGLNLPGGVKIFTVQSGSMEPAIHTGSIVLVRPESKYVKGDVITFRQEGAKDTASHRIVDVLEKDGQTEFRVKGDANNAPDSEIVVGNNIVGKVLFSIPLLGYLIGATRTQWGFIFLIVVPATIIIYSELNTIKNEAKRLLKESRKRKLTKAEKIEEKVGLEIDKIEKEVKKKI